MPYRWQAILRKTYRYVTAVMSLAWAEIHGLFFRGFIAVSFFAKNIRRRIKLGFKSVVAINFYSLLKALFKMRLNIKLNINLMAKLIGKKRLKSKIAIAIKEKFYLRQIHFLFFSANITFKFKAFYNRLVKERSNNKLAIGFKAKQNAYLRLYFKNKRIIEVTIGIIKKMTIGLIKKRTIRTLKRSEYSIPDIKIDFFANVRNASSFNIINMKSLTIGELKLKNIKSMKK